MCGIAGILDLQERPVSPGALRKMVDVQAHRGPDGEGMWIDGHVGLGHRRLSIIDLSQAGHQPMASHDGRFLLTFNGEIYNYVELKNELPAQAWRGSSDSEVLLAAYEEWGTGCLRKLNGIFAFAIWDKEKRELFCARDHVGVKPFYYAVHDGALYLASEIKALLAAGVPATPNERIIYEYLTHGVYDHSEETFFEGVKQIPPGHTLMVRDGRICVAPFWRLAERVWDTSGWSDARTEETFRELLEDSVRIQLRSDVPVGLHVSGGLDSSILARVVDRSHDGEARWRIFSFAYAGSPYDEEPYVRGLAETFGWDVSIAHLAPRDVPRLMERATWHQEQPCSGLPSLALQMLVESYRDSDIKVTLEGQGGDEVAAGYEYYMGAFWLDMKREHGEEAANREFESFAGVRGFSDEETKTAFLRNAIDAYARPGGSADGTRFARPHVLDPDFVKRAHAESRTYEAPFESALANMQYRDIFHTKLPRILRSCDRASMAYGRELRVPFLDYRLLEFSLGLPLRQKIRNGEQRFFVRNAYRQLLPTHIVKVPKRAVVNPQREWFQQELQPYIRDVLSSPSFGSRPFFVQKEVLAEYDRYCQTLPQNSFHIWQWLNLELWCRAFMD